MKHNIISQGAEAILIKEQDKKENILIKDRISKSYRHETLDKNLRTKRTRHEARIIEKASKIVPVPKILNVSETSIRMSFIEGKKVSDYLENPKITLQEQTEICRQIGQNISKLHENHIIHGDLTTSNMIWHEVNDSDLKLTEKQSAGHNKKCINSTNQIMGHINNLPKLYFIDFGLSFHSQRIEDKAVDLHLLKQALESKHFKNYEFLLKECLKNYKWAKSQEVLKQLEKVESRGRYKNKS